MTRKISLKNLESKLFSYRIVLISFVKLVFPSDLLSKYDKKLIFEQGPID